MLLNLHSERSSHLEGPVEANERRQRVLQASVRLCHPEAERHNPVTTDVPFDARHKNYLSQAPRRHLK